MLLTKLKTQSSTNPRIFNNSSQYPIFHWKKNTKFKTWYPNKTVKTYQKLEEEKKPTSKKTQNQELDTQIKQLKLTKKQRTPSSNTKSRTWHSNKNS